MSSFFTNKLNFSGTLKAYGEPATISYTVHFAWSEENSVYYPVESISEIAEAIDNNYKILFDFGDFDACIEDYEYGNYSGDLAFNYSYVYIENTGILEYRSVYRYMDNQETDTAINCQYFDYYSAYDSDVTPADIAQGETAFTKTGIITGTLTAGSAGYPSYVERSNSTPSLPKGLTKIGAYAFYNYSGLQLDALPSTLTSIDSYAFSYIRTTEFPPLPNGIISIGDNAFSHSSFKRLALPSSVTSLGGYAFAFSSFKEIDIGAGITHLSNYLFQNCTALDTLILRSPTVCSLESLLVFVYTPIAGYNESVGVVYVPRNLISQYEAAEYWSTLYSNGTCSFRAIEDSEYS